MKYILPGFKTLIFLYMAWLLTYCAFVYPHVVQKVQPPFAVFLLDTVTLIIHEAGHFFFSFFGRLLYMMGGTIFQVIFPLFLAGWVWYNYRPWTFFMLYWVGHSLVNGSVYIADAQKMQLQLISKGALHDWYYIFQSFNALGAADEVAGIVYFSGVVVMIMALSHGISYLIMDYRNAFLGIEESVAYE